MRIPLGVKVGAAAIALVAGTVGLAYALELPDGAADKASEATASVEDSGRDEVDTDRRMGSRQGEGSSVSGDVQAVIEDRDGGGCEFGQKVAEAARANSQGDDAGAEDPCDHEGGDSNDSTEARADKAARERDPKGSRDTGSDHAAKDDDSDSDDLTDEGDAQDKGGRPDDDSDEELEDEDEEEEGSDRGQGQGPNNDK